MDDKLFNELLDGVNEMIAIEKGEIQPHPDRVHSHDIPDVKAMRTEFGMKQSEFAAAIGASTGLVQSWELKRRIPSGVALKLLRLLEQDPQIINCLKTA
ncbi:helix-turn-helix domain-containing protein [Salmonella enterica subsp. arizonae serovar 38:z4,z23:-]|nr:helix-turn-helix domain-containing protein [Salmonella enterica subsp. houtenae]EBI0037705.1 helix-turn-helix domain-containing protein [Salmonella enterica subsp. diarizonae serovar 61:k:z35]EDU0973488.1 helix-turn-helix domain-containing protein [Salmonella enterica subsp. arizonae serovar 38:z4,z23:-]EIW3433852.1 helix-turn-helix domain-containing protein [Salmonella enterica subsp. houtenae serovar 38:z4,z23:-]